MDHPHCWRNTANNIRDLFPEDVSYVGFDISEKYIKAAQKKYGKRAKFIVGTAYDFLQKPDEYNLDSADLVLCVGLLHHLDNNDVLDVLQLAKKIMKNSGRFICFEPTFLIHQGSLSKWIMQKDRGRNIRTEQEWKALIGQAFDSFTTNTATGFRLMQYRHMVIDSGKNA